MIHGYVRIINALKKNFSVIPDMIVPMEVMKEISVIVIYVVQINFVVERANVFLKNRLKDLIVVFLYLSIFFSSKICDGSLHCPNGDDEDNCLHLSSTSKINKI